MTSGEVAITAIASIISATIAAVTAIRVAGKQQRTTVLPVELEMIFSGWKEELVRLREVNAILEDEVNTLADAHHIQQMAIHGLQVENAKLSNELSWLKAQNKV